MLRATAHPVGTAIAPHPAQRRDMLSVAGLPQPQEEEGSQEETLYRRHTEVPRLSRASVGRDPSLKPLGCVHHPLFRFNPCQGSYYFETKQLPPSERQSF